MDPSTTIDHRFVRANGIRWHCACAGDERAPLLLMLHGFPECWYSWRHQLRTLGQSGRLYCVAPDLRGYGDTEKPASGYGLRALATDAAALIGAFGRDRAFVVGHDWGGAITWALVATHPDRVERFAVLNCPPAEVFPAAFARSPAQLRRSWYMFYFQLPRWPERALTRHGARAIDRILRGAAARPEVFTDDDLRVYRQAMLKPGAARGALAYYRAAGRGLLRGTGPRSSIRYCRPALVLWGREDPALGSELLAGLEQRFEAPLQVRYLNGVGHFPQQEAPEAVNEALAAFFEREDPIAAR